MTVGEPSNTTGDPDRPPHQTRISRRDISFLWLGILLGALITSAAFSFAARSDGQPATQHDRAKEPAPRSVVLKLAHVLDASHPVHAAMELMAERTSEYSGGSLKMQIFPNGQLGSETECIEQVQRGVLAMVKTSAAPLESFIQEMALFGLPYLFRDDAHYWKVLHGDVGKELLAAGERVGLRGLCYYDSGSRSFYTTGAPILSPNDLEGRKIRVMSSKTSMDMLSQMGGAPTPIPWGEVYTALQQGMVDGAENNPPSLQTSRHFEVAKYYSLDEHTRIPDIVLFSRQIWDRLTDQQRRWIERAAADSVAFQRKQWQQKTEQALRELEIAGVKISRPDKRPFVARVQGMYGPLEGTHLGELVERVRAVK